MVVKVRVVGRSIEFEIYRGVVRKIPNNYKAYKKRSK